MSRTLIEPQTFDDVRNQLKLLKHWIQTVLNYTFVIFVFIIIS